MSALQNDVPYKTVSLTAVHEAVHDSEDAGPEIQDAVPFAQEYEVGEEDLAEELGCLYSSVGHANGISLIDFGLE